MSEDEDADLRVIREPPNGGRVFKYQNIYPSNMSMELCLNQCAAFGYPAAGGEFGDECCKRLFLTASLRLANSLDQGAVMWKMSLPTALALLPKPTATLRVLMTLFTFAVVLGVFRYERTSLFPIVRSLNTLL